MTKRYINFLVIPEGSPKSIKFRLSFFAGWLLLFTIAILLIFIIVFTVLQGQLLYQVLAGKSLKQENERLKRYNVRVVELEKELKEYKGFVQKVAELAGIKLDGKVVAQLPYNPVKIESVVKEETSQTLGKEEERLSMKDSVTEQTDSSTHMLTGAPIEGWTTRGFSRNMLNFGGEHPGVDIAAKIGTKVKATANGKVSLVTWDDVYGNLVAIDHGNGFVSYYGHNSQILVKAGDAVRQGDVIALSGNSGRSSAPHLHYEIRKDNIPIDPKDFLNQH